jgi:hypothetical protein
MQTSKMTVLTLLMLKAAAAEINDFESTFCGVLQQDILQGV